MVWGAAGRNQRIFCLHRLGGREPERMRVLKHRARLDDAGAGFLHIGGIGGLQASQLLVLVRDQGRPVEGRGRNSPAEAGRVLDLLMDVRGIDQKLFRHAAADHAGTAHPVLFGNHDARAMAGGDPGGANAARTSSDDEQIDVELSHGHPARMIFLTRFLHANRHPLRSKTLWNSYFLAAFAHFTAKFAIDGLAKLLRPLVHIGHAELNCPGLGGEQFLAKRRFVERHQILQFLFGKLAGVDLRHPVADFLLAAGKLLGDDHGNLIEILLIVEVALHQLILGLFNDVGDRVGVHVAGVFHRQNFLCRGDRRRRSLFEWRRRLSPLWHASGGQPPRHAVGRQNSRKALHSILLRLPRYRRSTTRLPSEPARTAGLARPMNRPCSTTPGIKASNPASRGASAIRPRWASTIQWPPAVTKTWPSLPLRTTICPETPLCANASPMARRVAARPNGTTSTGSGKRPRNSIHSESSALTIRRPEAAETIFSANSAAPQALLDVVGISSSC